MLQPQTIPTFCGGSRFRHYDQRWSTQTFRGPDYGKAAVTLDKESTTEMLNTLVDREYRNLCLLVGDALFMLPRKVYGYMTARNYVGSNARFPAYVGDSHLYAVREPYPQVFTGTVSRSVGNNSLFYCMSSHCNRRNGCDANSGSFNQHIRDRFEITKKSSLQWRCYDSELGLYVAIPMPKFCNPGHTGDRGGHCSLSVWYKTDDPDNLPKLIRGTPQELKEHFE